MKRILSLIIACCSLLGLEAQEYNRLVLRQLDNTLHAVPTDGLVLTFADGQLSAHNGNESTTLDLSTLDAMYFSDEDISGINEQQQSPVTLRLNGRLLMVSAPTGSQVLIASVGGMLIDHYRASDDAIQTPLRPGIYVVKVNDKSTKIHVK